MRRFHLTNLVGFVFFSSYFLYRLYLQINLLRKYPNGLSVFHWLNWLLIMGIFLFFALVYLGRKEALVKARGWRERFLPFVCAIIPTLLFETPRLVQLEFFQSHPLLLNSFKLLYPRSWNWWAIGFLIVGHIITLAGFLTLGRAFSIMTEARFHVSQGLYRYVRHPVYLGESIAIIGICLTVPNWCNIFLTVFWLGAQRYRASLEENKLSQAFPSYQTYKAQTGAYFPKLRA